MNAPISTVSPATAVAGRCRHCGDEIPSGGEVVVTDAEGAAQSFCCNGCAGAFALIHAAGAGAYYRYRTDFGPRPERALPEDYYQMIEAEAASDAAGRKSATFVIEGIHCASCVWLNEKLLGRLPGVEQIKVQLASGRARLLWNSERTSLAQIAAEAFRAGYRLRPAESGEGEREDQVSVDLLRRMAVAGFFAGNIMLVSVSLYAGYFDFMDRYTRNFFHLVSMALAAPVVFYSARVFFRGAWAALKLGVLGMDILTSLGIALAFGYSVAAVFQQGEHVYFDSICFVVFAVITGRFIERRLRMRALFLLDNLRAATPRQARLLDADDQPHWQAVERIQPGDRLLLTAGEALAVDARLLSPKAECDVSAINGEFQPAVYRAGEIIPGGARALGDGFRAEALRPASASYLSRLKELAESSIDSAPRGQLLAERIGRWFVAFILLAAALTLVYWALWRGDGGAAMLHTVALLIVACPCALNLAIPSAAIAAVQRAFVMGAALRDASALERLADADSFVFDKTGTLTEGKLQLRESRMFVDHEWSEAQLLALAAAIESQAAAHHPVAEGFRRAAAKRSEPPALSGARFHAGRGVEARWQDRLFRVGSFSWLQEGSSASISADPGAGLQGMRVYLWEQHEGQGDSPGRATALAVFTFDDALRPGATELVRRLSRRSTVRMVSGDRPENVVRIAAELGIAEAFGGQLPEEKLEALQGWKNSGKVVMVGDGANDSGALAAADVAVSFAHGAELAIAQADVLMLNASADRLADVFDLARAMRRKVRQNLGLAFLYNVALVPMAMAGMLSPLAGAIFMALSSITVVVNSLGLRRSSGPAENKAKQWNFAPTSR